jgi:hypothetical protein
MDDDERKLLEQRLVWLEREMIRLLYAVIGGLGLLIGGIAYGVTVDSFGGLGAFGIAVVAWVICGWYLRRTEFRGAPAHVKLMDP